MRASKKKIEFFLRSLSLSLENENEWDRKLSTLLHFLMWCALYTYTLTLSAEI